MSEHLDVLIVGAGLSGIGAACRLAQEHPGRAVALLEARADLGGTWDLFRYPGVRSDSDMLTLGYPFEPWTGDRSLADGPSILDYLRRTAERYGVTDRIRYRHRAVAADWSTDDARWTVTVERVADDGTPTTATVTCDFLYSCTGYYDYDEPHDAEIPGLADFGGDVVHPQFWPEDLDVAGRRVVVVGSGATAVTLVPVLADLGAEVTMLQRTPTWMGSVPHRDQTLALLRRVLPDRVAEPVAYRVARTRNMLFQAGFYRLTRLRPDLARSILTRRATRAVGDADVVAAHFTPSYDPWDQRVCALPDGDLFRAVREGTARVVTAHIDRVDASGLRLTTGEHLDADVVVTATGLRLLAFGGIEPSVDGEPVPLADQLVWNGAMVSGLPNFAFSIGYINASWTLRSDLTALLVCRVLRHLDRRRREGYAALVPQPDPSVRPRPLMELASGYVRRSIDSFPHAGDRGVWRMRQNYVADVVSTRSANLHRTLRPLRPGDDPGAPSGVREPEVARDTAGTGAR